MSGASAFSIEIVPPLPEPLSKAPYSGDVAALWRGPLRHHGELHQLIYRAAGDMYAHYPTNIAVLLGDLTSEAEAFAAACSHYVEIAGYRVAYARCKDGRVWFYDPPQVFGTEDDQPLAGEGVALELVAAAFDEAVRDVRRYIAALLA